MVVCLRNVQECFSRELLQLVWSILVPVVNFEFAVVNLWILLIVSGNGWAFQVLTVTAYLLGECLVC